jgi:putative ABC transport system permease protein
MVNPKFALRTLFKSPFVTIIAIISLGFGIGANAAMFSLFNQVLLSALPVFEPERLVNLGAPGPKPGSTSCGQPGPCSDVFSYPMFRDLEREQKVFTGLAAHKPFGANVAYRGQTSNGDAVLVSGSYFPVLGVQPALGRVLGPQDDRAVGESPVVVLSHAFWQSRFASNPGVLNDILTVNGKPLTIVGVAAKGFTGTTFGEQPNIFVPISMRRLMEPGNTGGFDDRRAYWAYLFARLKPGVEIEGARSQINGAYRSIINDVEAPLQEGMSAQTLELFRKREITMAPGWRGQSSAHAEANTPLTMLLGVTALVLLIACANIANLLLARSAARASEMAVRLSLGASRGQLIAQLLAESCLLALFGGIAGLFVAKWTLHGMVALLPADAETVVHMNLDTRVLLFSAALAIGTGLLFGLFPALHTTRPDLVSTLKNQAGQPSGAKGAARFRAALATAQIALSMALLVAAGLFTKSLVKITRVDLGIRADNLITFRVAPALNGYAQDRSKVLFERLEDELAAMGGVSSVSASGVPALANSNWGNSVAVEGFPAGPDTDTGSSYNLIAPGYFKTMGIPLISGREFTRADTRGAPRVAIVNEAFAKKFNLGRDAVGKHIGEGGPNANLDIEIVGLVQDAKYSRVKDVTPPQFFTPYRQDERRGALSFYVRTSGSVDAVMTDVPKVVARLDPNLPVVGLRTLAQQVRENIFLDRFISVLAAAFAGLATLLAAVGLYGVLAYTVSQRTREIGLRMALGSSPARVRTMVLGQVARMTLVGGAIGLGAAIWLGHVAESLLFQMKGYDLMVLVSSCLALSLVAFAAGLVPALRASRVDPMLALRYE